MHTYRYITDRRNLTGHYRHITNHGRRRDVLPPGRYGMSAFRLIITVVAASAVAAGLIVAVGFAPPASTMPCSMPEANVLPPAVPPTMPAPAPIVQLPTGRRPSNANDHAPMPKLGPLIASLFKPPAPNNHYSTPLQLQAELVPPGPNPAVPGQPPNTVRRVPNALPVPPTAPRLEPGPPPTASIAGAPTSLVEWVTGPNSPNKTLQRFGISGTDLGIPWDNGDPTNHQVLMAFGDSFGYCSVKGQQRRYNILFRSSNQDLSHGIRIADGVPNDKYSGSPVWTTGLAKQVVNTIHRAPHETGIIPTTAISIGKTQYMNYMSIKKWGRDGEWTTNYSAIARSIDKDRKSVV